MDNSDQRETETQALHAPSLSPPAAPPATPTDPILTVWGPFENLSLLGRGGFGAVYRAWDPRLQREVALKLLRPKAEASGQGMLLDEARMMARIRHPNVVPVYGVEAHGGRIGFWSELIQGKTLAALVAEQGPMGARECALAGVEICRALGAVHSAGLLHHDIKAENVMREQGGRILLMDFGLSHISGQGLTGAGTPVYMAPEMWNGAPAAITTDIYALGVLLYHLTTGRFPYPSRSLAELRDAVAGGKRVPLLDARPGLPASLARVIERACEPDPQRRPHSAGLLGLSLSEFLAAPETATPATAQSSRRWWILGAASTTAAAAFSGWTLWRARIHPSPDAQAPEQFFDAQKLIARYDQPGNIDRAVQLLDATIESDPNFALAFSLRSQANATLYITNRKKEVLDRATADANRALALNKNLSPVYVTLGILHIATGKRDIAAQDLQRALSLDASNPAAHRVMGTLLGQQGRAADARASFQKAIDLDPDDWQNYYSLANFVQRAGDNNGALHFFEQALEHAPNNPLVLNNLGFTYLQKDDFAKAIETLRAAIAISPRYLSYSNLCSALMLESHYDDAVRACRQAVELEPNQFSAWGDLAGAYQWSPGGKAQAVEHYKKAIALAEEARKVTPKDARLLVLLGSYMATLGERVRSLAYIHQAEALAPRDINILFRAGEALEIAGRREEAIAKVSEALRLGFSPVVLQRSPELAGLRADPRFRNRKP